MPSGFSEEHISFLPVRSASYTGGPLADLSILVVEESKLSSHSIRSLCIQLGARYRWANNIASAKRHLKSYRPDVVIVDMCQRDGDGAELLRTLNEAKPRIHVLLGMSAQPDFMADALQAGADEFIDKPIINAAVFQHAITSALPEHLQFRKPMIIPEQRIVYDQRLMQEDLAHGLRLLDESRDDQNLEYAASFLFGIAAVAGDIPMRDAAHMLLAKTGCQMQDAADIEKVRRLLEARLFSGQAPAPDRALRTITGQ